MSNADQAAAAAAGNVRRVKARRSLLQQQQQQTKRNAASGAPNRTRIARNAALRFGEGSGKDDEREQERREREAERVRRKKERRLDELERGQASSASWNENSTAHIPAASTSAAAIAGLLAGRQTEEADSFDSLPAASATGSSSSGRAKKKQNAELKRLLSHRRGLRALLEDASTSTTFTKAPINFLTALHVPFRYPSHRSTAALCSICGYWGDVTCVRCGDRVCSMECSTTHDETRCERPIGRV